MGNSQDPVSMATEYGSNYIYFTPFQKRQQCLEIPFVSHANEWWEISCVARMDLKLEQENL